jgi:hypothetical protein
MRRYRLRIVLLSLGVLFGFGSAFHHMAHGDHCHHGDHHDRERAGHWEWREDHP